MKRQPIARAFLPLLFLTQLVCSQQQPPEDLKPVIEQLDKAATEMVKDPQVASFTLGLVRPSAAPRMA